MKKYILLLTGFLASLSAFAHPGHGSTGGYTITHYFVEPEHALVILTILAVAIIMVKRFRRVPAKK